eukprot:comp20596_c1_seq1/m.26537 comp20596_c1_seq1/g.26537  ORF comp20596_c1_seq1/g.26537 comp20596_c1_seq1/m.26537 type:complete len:451 (-) comp20596_c1_seq1:230-1582(-)
MEGSVVPYKHQLLIFFFFIISSFFTLSNASSIAPRAHDVQENSRDRRQTSPSLTISTIAPDKAWEASNPFGPTLFSRLVTQSVVTDPATNLFTSAQKPKPPPSTSTITTSMTRDDKLTQTLVNGYLMAEAGEGGKSPRVTKVALNPKDPTTAKVLLQYSAMIKRRPNMMAAGAAGSGVPAGSPTQTPLDPKEPGRNASSSGSSANGGSMGVAVIIGPDDRRVVSWQARATAPPTKWVGKLWLNFGQYSQTCSGSLIGPFHVFTAGHCIHEGYGGRMMTGGYFTITILSNGRYVEARYDFKRWWTTSGWAYYGNWGDDIAMIELNPRYPPNVGYFGFGNYGLQVNMGISTAGFPGDKMDQGMYTMSCRVLGFLPVNTITHSCDIFRGQSGSPLYLTFPNQPIANRYGVVSVVSWEEQRTGRNGGPIISNAHFTLICGWFAQSFPSRCGVRR